ncbi:MAG: hypothetical protein GXO82_05260 [Chlorobi bacterium]|nr:hypothetical protein [Chlorobiota bacterium]
MTSDIIESTIDSLLVQLGGAEKTRLERGVRQAARLWREDDGSITEFRSFCAKYFIADSVLLDKTFNRLEHNLMLISGYLRELNRDLNVPLQLDTGPILPVDYLFGEFSPSVHVNEDMFATKIAFTTLLNFPLFSLQERLELGPNWTRRQWAEARLAQRFSGRVPAMANQQVASAYTITDSYISAYNIYMHNVLDEKGQRLFPEGLKLISHWGLRDELKAQYDKPGGFVRQKLIQRIMERIIDQQIPAVVINNPDVDWRPSDNTVTPHPDAANQAPSATAEPDTRYAMWLRVFHAEKSLDPYYPEEPTFIDRRFNRDREIPELEVEELFRSVLSSPLIARTANLISKRLGRSLEPFDIWYNGFRTKSRYTEDELDRIVSKKYPTVESFQRDIPNILVKLGFSFETARWLSERIVVDPSRGAGHAMGAGRLVDKAHLRTRIPEGGMKYKGYNIAIHELGHNVEQTFSFQGIDHTLLRGVPNTAFTEGFAFIFQSRDLELLGLAGRNPEAEHYKALDVLWSTYEIAGVAMVDMRVWKWLYAHPDAGPAELKSAVQTIARDVWNEFFAPVFGVKDVTLLAIYSHMIDGGMYTPDYPLGHIISYQIEQYMKSRSLAAEMERMCKIGNVSPDLWMKLAVGKPISTDPLLSQAREALDILEKK